MQNRSVYSQAPTSLLASQKGDIEPTTLACVQTKCPIAKELQVPSGGCTIQHHHSSLMLEHVAQHTNAAEYNAYQCLQFLLAGSQLPPAHVFWSAPSSSNRDVENQTARTLSCHHQIAPLRPKTAYHETPGSQWQTRRCIALPLITKCYFPLYEARDPRRECHLVFSIQIFIAESTTA